MCTDGKRMLVHRDTNESIGHARLYAVGQLAGDNFVRHMSGGVLKTARALLVNAHKYACVHNVLAHACAQVQHIVLAQLAYIRTQRSQPHTVRYNFHRRQSIR
jgi:hypothetical protein